jgi:peptidoglycan/xylan/chitin deacetylase (PgdA/CDA1 family)
MTVTLTSPHEDVLLSIFGVDGAVEAEPLPTAEPTPSPVAAKPTPAGPPDNVIYLTFDDGPDPQWTPQVLSILAGYNARATFFVLGRSAQRYPDLIQAEYDAGHTVANHTFDHQSLSGLCREAFFNEVEATKAILGDKSVPCLRPPYGRMDSHTRARAAELGYEIVMWDIDTMDWKRPGVTSIANEVLAKAHPGAVVLMHDGGGDRSQTVEALESILGGLEAQGYRFEPLCRNQDGPNTCWPFS